MVSCTTHRQENHRGAPQSYHPGSAAREGAGELPRFAELSVVSMRHPVNIDGRTLPTGTKGTVVAAYSDGIGYEVEVFEPFHAVVTVKAGDLAA